MYQARSLIGSDASGLSDPFARVICGEFCKSTQVIDETLSPTWDELLLFDDILIYGTDEEIKKDPPSIVIEIFDQDKVVSDQFFFFFSFFFPPSLSSPSFLSSILSVYSTALPNRYALLLLILSLK